MPKITIKQFASEVRKMMLWQEEYNDNKYLNLNYLIKQENLVKQQIKLILEEK